ncbi:putative ATP-dependent RNA helicase rrp3 [Boletus reticuloceps]|uniref:Putative ATP-dependent RNA helicase rrp3 n=1 Tax=Boletus reticuloceps TaxID=495285 RepID=A0A8I2YNT6_9AGAM|nr:putative ATP-dependent RNA helicase rrp3 [Boletus reticuloceps]
MPTPDEASTSTTKTFRDLGLIEPLLQALDQINFKTPTESNNKPFPTLSRAVISSVSQKRGQEKLLHSLYPSYKNYGRNQKDYLLASSHPHVMDEADRLLDMDFGADIDQILKAIPKERTTYLFSATMTTKVAKLQRASLSSPVRVEVSSKYQTVSTLLQYYLFVPLIQKDAHLICLANELASNSIIVFTRTVHDAQRLSIILRTLGFPAVPLHGQLSQSQRLGALNKFKTGGRKVLVATDIASRGLDIPSVDVVINFDIPTHSKDYIHRVGRTARAGRAGKSITIVTQYDVELLQRIEKVIGKKLELFPTSKEEVMLLKERVDEAGRLAVNELKEEAKANGGKKRKRYGGEARDDKDRDDDVVEAGMPRTKRSKGHR